VIVVTVATSVAEQVPPKCGEVLILVVSITYCALDESAVTFLNVVSTSAG
jgi:hypothetical protein